MRATRGVARGLASIAVAAVTSSVAIAPRANAQDLRPVVVVIPTLGNDHQFDLDYTVAHLAALLDAISPDAVVLNDATTWLARGCPLGPLVPEVHVALAFASERRIGIFGTRGWPADAYAASVRSVQADNARLRDTAAAFRTARAALDAKAAFITREYSGNAMPQSIERLVAGGFLTREAALTTSQKRAAAAQAASFADSVERVISTHRAQKRWAVLTAWAQARVVGESLRTRPGLRVIPIDSFLPLPPERIDRQMDYRNLAWILSGVLDEWYGMWAPQAFPVGRVTSLLDKLESVAPGDPVTEFLRARWLMQQRDYAAAKVILSRLAVLTPDTRFPFPVNGKWTRPPWNSVGRKSRLNLAFVHDYGGQRDQALALYRGLLAEGEALNDDARAFGYLYDDVRSVVESYIGFPYTGLPSEAYRHLASIVRIPDCAPK